ncbi:hypothetical protein [uncultured Draconibacterium sp.]|mgnify:CR=1 FL=1|nr:hypothetical protein [uncultured Draconibacterium sp.]
MEILKLVLLAIALLGIGLFGMAVRIVFLKGGKFPNTHVGANKHLKKNGVYCATTQDKLAQRKARKELAFKKLSFATDTEAGK